MRLLPLQRLWPSAGPLPADVERRAWLRMLPGEIAGLALFLAVMMGTWWLVLLITGDAVDWVFRRPWLLTAVSVVVVVTIPPILVDPVVWRLRWRTLARIRLEGGYCPACAYKIEGLPAAGDGCVVCAECGAAWRANTLAYSANPLPPSSRERADCPAAQG